MRRAQVALTTMATYGQVMFAHSQMFPDGQPHLLCWSSQPCVEGKAANPGELRTLSDVIQSRVAQMQGLQSLTGEGVGTGARPMHVGVFPREICYG